MVSAIISSKGLLATFMLVVVAGCTCSNELTTPREVEPTTRATLRFVHASPDAPTLSCWQNDKAFADQITYNGTVMAAASLPSEMRNLRFTDGTSTALLSVNVNLTADVQHTFVVLDHVDRLRGVLMKDIQPTPVIEHAQVRVLHADPSHTTITLIDASGIEEVSFTEVSTWRSVPVGGTLAIKLDENTTLTVPSETMTDGASFTIIVRDPQGPGEPLVQVRIP